MNTPETLARVLVPLFAAVTLVGCGDSEIDGAPRARLEPSPNTPAVQMAQSAANHPQRTIALVAERSSVEFVGAKVTGSHRGSFKTPTGTAELAEDGTLRGLSVEIDTRNLAIEPAKLAEHPRSPDFFDVEQYPEATFRMVSARPKAGADGQIHELTGDLSIRGKSHRITFPASVRVTDGNVDASAAFKIDRRKFDINYAGMADDLIEHDVLLDLSLRFEG